MKTFHLQATQYYIRSSQVFHSSSIRVPALLFISKTDPVGTVPSNLSLRDTWESTGIKVRFVCVVRVCWLMRITGETYMFILQTYVKIFEESPHVAHFYKYPKEYVAELYAFLQKLNLIQNEAKIRSRL